MADDIANDAIERIEKRLDDVERRLPLHDHGGEPACLACLQPLIEAAHVLALSHGERHGTEGEDPAALGVQTKLSAGAPTNVAPEGTLCRVIPDNDFYMNKGGSTSWELQQRGQHFGAATELTIASGVITVTKGQHTVTVQSGSTDNLDTINGLVANQVLLLRPTDGAKTIVVKPGTGNVLCRGNADITMDDIQDFVQIFSPDGTTAYAQ